MSLSASQKQFIQNIQSDAYFYGSMIVIVLLPLLSNGYGWIAPTVSSRFHSINLAIGFVLIGWAIYHWIMMYMHRKHARSLVNDAVAQNLMTAEIQTSALRAIKEALKPIERRVNALVSIALLLGIASVMRSGSALYTRNFSDHSPKM